MNKRALAIFLIIFGILAIAGIAYWTLHTTELPSSPAPAAPAPAEPVVPEAPPAPSPAPAPAPRRAPTSEDQEQFLLRQRALQFSSRQGSYTNDDGFAAIQDIYLDVTPTVRSFYQAERERWTREHPLANGSWVKTTRALSSQITSELPLANKNEATVSVQAQQIIEANQQPAVITYKEIILMFTRDQGRWVVSRVEEKVLDL